MWSCMQARKNCDVKEKVEQSTWFFILVSESSAWLGRRYLTRTSTFRLRFKFFLVMSVLDVNNCKTVILSASKITRMAFNSPLSVKQWLYHYDIPSGSAEDQQVCKTESEAWRYQGWHQGITGHWTMIQWISITLITAGKAEWDCHADWCCKWCRGAGSDHGWRWKGNWLKIKMNWKKGPWRVRDLFCQFPIPESILKGLKRVAQIGAQSSIKEPVVELILVNKLQSSSKPHIYCPL